MSTNPNLTDANLKNYVNGLSNNDLSNFSNELIADFDMAISSRFTLSGSQASSLIQTPHPSKLALAQSFKSYSDMVNAGYTGEFDVIGLDPTGGGTPPQGISIKINVKYNPHTQETEVELIVEWTKN
jgi:hypothetical protein